MRLWALTKDRKESEISLIVVSVEKFETLLDEFSSSSWSWNHLTIHGEFNRSVDQMFLRDRRIPIKAWKHSRKKVRASVFFAFEETASDATGRRHSVDSWLWIKRTTALVDTCLLFALPDDGEFFLSGEGNSFQLHSRARFAYFHILVWGVYWPCYNYDKCDCSVSTNGNFSSATNFARWLAFFLIRRSSKEFVDIQNMEETLVLL